MPAPQPRRNSPGRPGSGGARRGSSRSTGSRSGVSRQAGDDARGGARSGRGDSASGGARGGQRRSPGSGSSNRPGGRNTRWSDSDGRSDGGASGGRRQGGRGAPPRGPARSAPGRAGPSRSKSSKGPARSDDRRYGGSNREEGGRRRYRRNGEGNSVGGGQRQGQDSRPAAENYRRSNGARRGGGSRAGQGGHGRGFGRPLRPEWQERAREDRRETREEREAREPRNEAERRAAQVRSRGGGTARLGQFPAEREEHIDQWIDEGPVREEAEQAIRRARPAQASNFELDSEVRDRVNASAPSPQRAAKLRERLLGAFVSLERERYAEARRIGNQLSRELSDVAAVHELIGLANYRLGEWRKAATALERAQTLNPDPDTMPILMDSLRALGRHDDVAEVWRELRQASPRHETMAEGRIIMAGSLSDRGELAAAIAEMQQARSKPKRVRDHHLRQWYVLADLLDRAGDTVGAVRFFERIAMSDADFVDVRQRLRALGR